MKLLLVIAFVYLAYRVGKSWVKRNLGTINPGRDASGAIDDVMVRDPVCGIYFPRREGVELRHRGSVHQFCSPTCRDRFLEEQQEK